MYPSPKGRLYGQLKSQRLSTKSISEPMYEITRHFGFSEHSLPDAGSSFSPKVFMVSSCSIISKLVQVYV
jgi:hypothetical protein